MIVTTFIVFISWTLATGFIAYDCEGPVLNMTTISLKGVEECPQPESDYQSEQIMAKVIQRNEIKLVPVQACLVEITRIIYYCGMHSHTSAVTNGIANYVYKVGAEECKNIHRFRTFQIYQQLIGDINRNGTTSASLVAYGSLTPDGTCKGTTYHENGRTWDNVVITAAIKIQIKDYLASVKLDSNEIILLGGFKCSYLNGYCLDSTYGETVWDYTPDTSCDAGLSLLYNGGARIVSTKHDQKYLVVEQGGKIFAVSLLKTFFLCSYEVWQTEHPKLIVLFGNSNHILPTMPLLVQNTDMMLYVNSKFLYIEQSFKNSIENLYIDTVYRRCLLHREILKNRLILAQVFPEAISPLLKQNPGVVGRILGEVIHLIQCTPKVVEIRRTDRCYNQLPIKIEDQNYFVSPNTHIIQRQAEEVDCNPLTPPIFNIDNQWIGFIPQPIIKTIPDVLRVQNDPKLHFTPIRSLGSDGIYTLEEINKVQRNLLFGIERKNIENIISRKIAGQDTDSQGYTTVNLFNKEELKKMATNTFRQLWEWFTDIGIFISGLIGFYYIIVLIRCVGEIGLRAFTLYKTIGFSWYLVASVWGALTNWFLRQNLLNNHPGTNPSGSANVVESAPADKVNESLYPNIQGPSHWSRQQ